MATSPDYYEVLQVSPNAEPEVIQVAYTRLARTWHSERTRGNPSASQQLALPLEAYVILSDRDKREEYDLRKARCAEGGDNGDLPQAEGSNVEGATAEEQLTAGPTASAPRTGSGLCWCCRRNEANGKSTKVTLSRLLDHERDWLGNETYHFLTIDINIPRCSHCQSQHAKRLMLLQVPTIIGLLLLLLAACITRLPSRGMADFWIAAVGIVVLFGGLFWGDKAEQSWRDRMYAHYPPVQALLKAGWSLIRAR